MRRKKPEEVVKGALKRPVDDGKYINSRFSIQVFNKIYEQAQEEGVQPAAIVRLMVEHYYNCKLRS